MPVASASSVRTSLTTSALKTRLLVYGQVEVGVLGDAGIGVEIGVGVVRAAPHRHAQSGGLARAQGLGAADGTEGAFGPERVVAGRVRACRRPVRA
jgi:hypothetical protein